MVYHLVGSRLAGQSGECMAQTDRLADIVAPGLSSKRFAILCATLSAFDSHRSGLTSLRSRLLSHIGDAILEFFQPTPSNSECISLSSANDIPHKDSWPGDAEEVANSQKQLYHAVMHTLAHRVVQTWPAEKLEAAELHHLAIYSLFLCYLLESNKALLDASVLPGKIPRYYNGLQLKKTPDRNDLLFLSYEAVRDAAGGRESRSLRLRRPYSFTLAALFERLESYERCKSAAEQANVWRTTADYVSAMVAGYTNVATTY